MKKIFLILIVILTFSMSFNVPSAFASSDNPLFVTITAESCHSCQKLKPVVENLENNFNGKVTFITLDITSRASIEEAKSKAQEYGIIDFFNKNKSTVPKVGILCPGGKVEKEFLGEIDQNIYESALNELLTDPVHLCSL
ncbi:MAG: hypothetical protein A3B68_02725 [Candidatus Melainabacteria bacterium RIFCSPHIGHO2_02_FULL_34_12]|nr:MAG: hypothetical protein A3B68_02725 [Candidatus Melainabacteria bacterium RIFCSPHIGHO2_02_FULL_34_12]